MINPGDTLEAWFFLGAAGVGALACFAAAFVALHRARAIEDIPTARVRSAPQGYVELEGLGHPLGGEPLIAPLTLAPCIWYRYKIEEKDQSGRHHNWRTIQSGTSEDLFILNDSTGECVIDPEGASVTTEIKKVWYGNSANPLAGVNASRLTRLIGGDNYRYTEEYLLPGMPLYAIGQFRTEGGATELPDTPAAVRERLREWKRDPARLRERFDANGDGQIDPDEWENARAAARREVERENRGLREIPPHHILRKPDNPRQSFLISACPQPALVQRYRRHTALYFAGFLGCGALAVWLAGQLLETRW